MTEKAYKLLAIQENITNRSAKDLIDRGVVYALGKKVVMARAMMHVNMRFRVDEINKVKIIFEGENIVAIDKPAFVTSEQISKKQGHRLLHRLDKETSGVLLLVKNDEFREKAIHEFKMHNVKKEYIAWVSGIVIEEFTIDKPILTIKNKNQSHSKIAEDGREAISIVEPLFIEGKTSKVKVTIKTGRTHQIRVHLKSEGYPIIGDELYGGKKHKRVLLHAHKIELFDYKFESNEPKNFKV
jgi:23S rRNA pseudouridine1911/1915/1917 synthase